MKWIWLALLGFALPLLVLLAAAAALFRPGLPPAAQASLDAYLAQHGGGAQAITVQTGRAAHPSAFTRELGAAHYGDDYYFGGAGTESRPAPFPPTDLWCVTLSGGDKPATVLVALHEDLYVGAWLVHEPRTPADAAAICE